MKLKMLSFDYLSSTKVLFGENKIEKLGEEIKRYTDHILLVYGSRSLKASGLYNRIMEILVRNGIRHEELHGVTSNPSIIKVREGVNICKDNNIDFILAVGGGSVIECSKGIAAGARYQRDPWDFYSEQISVNDALPLGTVLTLASAGSEMNGISTVRNEQEDEKLVIESDLLRPIFSILDPTYTLNVSRSQTAAGIIDTFCHVIEHYFGLGESTFLQDRLAEGLLKTCIKYGPIVMVEGKNYEARANLMWASSLALSGLLDCGKARDWIPHIIENAISATHDGVHAHSLAIITLCWIEHILKNEDPDRFIEYSKNVWRIEGQDRYATARQGIEKTKDFFRELFMPGTLAELHIDIDMEKIAHKAISHRGINSLRKLSKNEVLMILQEASAVDSLNSSSDLQIIKHLEEKLQIELEELGNKPIWHITGYRTDSNQNVIGLYLDNEPLDGGHLKELLLLILQLKSLQELWLTRCNLAQFPMEIVQLKSLTKLVLSGNQITILPSEIRQLKNLTDLDLSQNQIKKLPREITELKKLKQLKVMGNQLEDPPQEIAERGFDEICKYWETHSVETFDVFLAHNNEDKKVIEAIAEQLRQRGLKPWLDKEQIPPGRWFQDVIQHAITRAKSIAIFIGLKGLGKWQIMELRSAISQCVERDIPIIPILLPGVTEPPLDLLFLREKEWLRFTQIDDSEALDNLEWGITGEHPQRKL